MTDYDWKRLGRLLTERRVELGHPKRQPWVRDVLGLTHDRTQSDIENARRTNYDRTTLAQIEDQYEWQHGSIQAVLEGGDPTPRYKMREGAIWDSRHDQLVANGLIAPDPAEAVYNRWAQVQSTLSSIEFEYARSRGIDQSEAHDELAETHLMFQEVQAGTGRRWTPPWEDWEEEFGPKARPWSHQWWEEWETERMALEDADRRASIIEGIEREAALLKITVGKYGEKYGFDFEEAAADLEIDIPDKDAAEVDRGERRITRFERDTRPSQGGVDRRAEMQQIDDIAARDEDSAS